MTAFDKSPIVTLDDVDVQRGEFVLCQGVNLTLNAGDICHLIGENGLGKTTLLSQIAGLLPMVSGRVVYHQGDIHPVYVSHQLGISGSLTVAQNLAFLLSLYGVDAHRDVIDTPWVVAQIENRINDFADQGGAVLMTSHQAIGVKTGVLDLAEFAL